MVNIRKEERYLLGVDLAKSLDFTSFAVVHMEFDLKLNDFVYHLVGLDRIRGVDYPKITDLILETAKRLRGKVFDGAWDGPHVCMDASGLGAPIRDYLKQSGWFGGGMHGRSIFPVVFTGGEAARYDTVTRNYNISKSIIISNFLSLMQHRRFDYAPGLEALPLLDQEIANFKYHLTPSGHTGFDAEQGAHDDLICATCVPLIIGEWRYSLKQRAKVGPKPSWM